MGGSAEQPLWAYVADWPPYRSDPARPTASSPWEPATPHGDITMGSGRKPTSPGKQPPANARTPMSW
jgi:hypothetical protein